MVSADKLLDECNYIDKLKRQISWDKTKCINTSIHEKMLVKTRQEVELIKKEIDEALVWHSKKHKFYEIKDALNSTIRNRNLELKYIKQKYKVYKDENFDLETDNRNMKDQIEGLISLVDLHVAEKRELQYELYTLEKKYDEVFQDAHTEIQRLEKTNNDYLNKYIAGTTELHKAENQNWKQRDTEASEHYEIVSSLKEMIHEKEGWLRTNRYRITFDQAKAVKHSINELKSLIDGTFYD